MSTKICVMADFEKNTGKCKNSGLCNLCCQICHYEVGYDEEGKEIEQFTNWLTEYEED